MGRARLYSSAVLVGIAAVIVYALLVISPRASFALDLHQYLEAADTVIHLESPYHEPGTPIEGLYAYAYPPLLAFGFAPWLLFPIGLAEYLAVVLYIVAILAALWLCGVRDIRCHALATMSAPVALGAEATNATALVCLFAALTWRYRSGIGAGAALTIKLIGWPLLVWLAAIGRGRHAAIGAAAAVVLTFVPWAVIGFAGLTDYPALLEAVDEKWAPETFSLAGSGLPGGRALSLVLAAACVVSCWWRGRKGDEAGSFALAIGAILVASPILWNHYFALLFVAIAARYPRLHPLWFVMLGYWVLPGGFHVDAWMTAFALTLTGAIVLWLSRPWPAFTPRSIRRGSLAGERPPTGADVADVPAGG
jgi:hypothetical protein